jgi:hypothetical protein
MSVSTHSANASHAGGSSGRSPPSSWVRSVCRPPTPCIVQRPQRAGPATGPSVGPRRATHRHMLKQLRRGAAEAQSARVCACGDCLTSINRVAEVQKRWPSRSSCRHAAISSATGASERG